MIDIKIIVFKKNSNGSYLIFYQQFNVNKNNFKTFKSIIEYFYYSKKYSRKKEFNITIIYINIYIINNISK